MKRTLPLLHGPDQRPVDELEGAVGLLGVLADQVGGRGVAVAGHRDQVIAEGGLDQAVLPVPGGPYSRAGTPASRSLRRASTSGMSASDLGW